MMTQDENEIELKRNELAEYFNCAPSQINYVLATRFTPDHGYLIQSRRGGGGGYIRIFPHASGYFGAARLFYWRRGSGDHITALKADHLITQLKERSVVTCHRGEYHESCDC